MEIRSFYSNSRKNLYRADAAKRGGEFWERFLLGIFESYQPAGGIKLHVVRAYLAAMEGAEDE